MRIHADDVAFDRKLITSVTSARFVAAIKWAHEHWNQSCPLSLHAMRAAREFVPMREILCTLPVCNRCPHLRRWSDVLRALPQSLRLQNFRLIDAAIHRVAATPFACKPPRDNITAEACISRGDWACRCALPKGFPLWFSAISFI